MELSELHNPSCKLHASQSFEDHSPVRERRHSDVSDIFLSPEAYKATQAVEFIAEHLRNEDEYVQVRALKCCPKDPAQGTQKVAFLAFSVSLWEWSGLQWRKV